MGPVLVLTGGPAVGKSTISRLLAESRERAAVIEVDDVRQFVVSGAAAPWEGQEGLRQQRLGVENACALATRFVAEKIEVVISDVLNPETTALYRGLLPDCLVVRLVAAPAEVRRRAGTRPWYLTEEEFALLHELDRSRPVPADHVLDVTVLSPAATCLAVNALWAAVRAEPRR
ncbi:hypothetical protein GCM10009841_36260 [Microlunatus panaciterrae]|uniref:Broad-specificity NMP kinase n=1 Tax=Microlunatus panaciterrae TaxID=400768 RepID=A0ABS2RJA6_9ACTN|nr:hypothetical protein [Microlunatus panaciterrae]MBM7798286.1 broad-specificity NMP kinase [Microlunatus panaciterrae]